MKFEIKSRFTGSVLFETEAASFKAAVEKAVELSADLGDADLGDAYLRDADLRDADLRGADLRGADLGGANLGDANLRDIKSDFLSRLALAKDESVGLYKALVEGKINGSAYEGECACFCGTVAKLRGENYKEMSIDLRPDSGCPTERWFLAIRTGDTPQNNPVSKITAEWTEEFMRENGIPIPEMVTSWKEAR